ncbi:MAG: redoxin family protein [Dyadobacter sp.]|uniref:TlpA family protein disulfide reductase n=1 Tax=Dyadobacter sp. TaxID=1914288 RepID=UPI001B26CCFE|nr:TlpA disulfide reductase family protein [Dyadobacter sp.]MBO9611603.1 redoxin family protein [Dyadobacter sp.]
MRSSTLFFLFFITIIFQLVGCNQKKNKSVKISIHHHKAAGDTLKILTTNMVNLDTIELGRLILDSAGKGVSEFELDAPVFASATAGHLATSFFISPGDELAILPSKPGAKFSIGYEGDGAAFNQILNEASQFRNGLERWNGNYAIRLNQDEFLKAKDSLQRGYDQLLARLKLEKQVSEEMVDVFARQTKMSVLFYQFNYAIGRDSSEIPATVSEAIKEMPIDTIALKTRMFDYALIASFFYQHRINNAIYEENESMDGDSLDAIFPLLVERKIKSSKYPKMIEDYLRVKSADYQIRLDGITASTTKLVRLFEKEIASDEFKSTIRKDIARWEKIGPGKPAPEFSGTTPDGKKISLSDLRGKVVYVDIWGTWCGPCVEEFPDSKKVMADFEGNDKVAFLYVSIDRDTLAWKKMATSSKVPEGIHVITGTDSPNSIWNLYYVWGVPRYLLIDADGRMVATHAERPSSGKVTAELRKLLGVEKLAQN